MMEGAAAKLNHKTYMYKSLLIIGLILLPFSAFSQEKLVYDVTIAGISIGEMIATKKTDGDKTSYEINSSVSFWFFGKINLDFNTKAYFSGRQFMRSDVNSKTNKGNFFTKINWDKDHYNVQARNYKHEMDTVIRKPMYYSSAAFFFVEPKQVKEFIPEAVGLPTTITKGKDFYEVTVNGNKNRYFYTDGVMTRAVMEFPIKNYVLKLKQ
jgi:hypothetical protein